MQAVIKTWFDYLAEGKFMGLRCKECGTIECPPYAICNSCGEHDMEWVEMSGEGELLTFSRSLMGNYPYNDDDILIGWVRLKEGPMFSATIVDAPDDEEPLVAKLPIPVKVEIVPIEKENNLFFPAFRMLGD